MNFTERELELAKGVAREQYGAELTDDYIRYVQGYFRTELRDSTIAAAMISVEGLLGSDVDMDIETYRDPNGERTWKVRLLRKYEYQGLGDTLAEAIDDALEAWTAAQS